MTLHEVLDEKNKLDPSAIAAATHILTSLFLFKNNLKCFFIVKINYCSKKISGGGGFIIMADTRIMCCTKSFLLWQNSNVNKKLSTGL